MAEKISHKMPESLRRLGKGEYEVRGTKLRIVQDGDSGKWTVQGHSDDLGAFGSRGAALGKLAELGLVPAQPAEAKPVEEMTAKELTEVKPELHPDAQPKAESEPAKTEEPKRRPRTRKQPAKAAAKV